MKLKVYLMVKNQCRYCIELVAGDFCCCKAKDEVRSEDSCKRKTGCPLFDFCSVDAFGKTNFDEAKWKRKLRYEQPSFDI